MATVVFSQQLRTKETTHIHTFLTRNTIENCIFARLFPIRIGNDAGFFNL